jgi:hypothetical protein
MNQPAPFASPLLVSIPGSALADLRLPGSLFGWRELRDAVLPPDLRLALRLVMDHAATARLRVRFLARPEIFTHGASRAWLDARIAGSTDHLILTDGQALRPVAGLDNHLFFFARGRPSAEHALRRIASVAPELFAGLASQVNGALALRIGATRIRPPTRLIGAAANPPLGRLLVAPFLLHPAIEKTAQALAEAALPPDEAPPADRPAHLIPLSEAALADAPFVAWLARELRGATLGTAERMPLLLLPWLDRAEAELADQIAPVLRALQAAAVPFPRMLTWAVRLATEPPPPEAMAGGRITLHPATPFWRLGTRLAAEAPVELAGSGPLAPARDLLAAWSGQAIALRRTAPGTAHRPVSTFGVP